MPRALTAEQVEDFRDELCGVAADLFASQGYEAVTMRSIAGELGVSAMTPYRYFECKGAIYREVRERAFARFGRRVADAARGEADPVARLRLLCRAYLGFALDEPGAYRIMFEFDSPAEAARSEREAGAAADTWAPLLETVEDIIRAGLSDEDPLTLAHLCWVQVHGLASLHISNRLGFGRSFDDLVDPLFDSLMRGILTRPEGGTR